MNNYYLTQLLRVRNPGVASLDHSGSGSLSHKAAVILWLGLQPLNIRLTWRFWIEDDPRDNGAPLPHYLGSFTGPHETWLPSDWGLRDRERQTQHLDRSCSLFTTEWWICPSPLNSICPKWVTKSSPPSKGRELGSTSWYQRICGYFFKPPQSAYISRGDQNPCAALPLSLSPSPGWMGRTPKCWRRGPQGRREPDPWVRTQRRAPNSAASWALKEETWGHLAGSVY